jgi:hypothetical protein
MEDLSVFRTQLCGVVSAEVWAHIAPAYVRLLELEQEPVYQPLPGMEIWQQLLNSHAPLGVLLALCLHGWKGSVRELLLHQTTPSGGLTVGIEPLLFAASRGHVAVVRLLLEWPQHECGAIWAQYVAYAAAAELAARCGHAAVVRLLLQSMAASSCRWVAIKQANPETSTPQPLTLNHQLLTLNSPLECADVSKAAAAAATRAGHAHITAELRQMQSEVIAVVRVAHGMGLDRGGESASQQCVPTTDAHLHHGWCRHVPMCKPCCDCLVTVPAAIHRFARHTR